MWIYEITSIKFLIIHEWMTHQKHLIWEPVSFGQPSYQLLCAWGMQINFISALGGAWEEETVCMHTQIIQKEANWFGGIISCFGFPTSLPPPIAVVIESCLCSDCWQLKDSCCQGTSGHVPSNDLINYPSLCAVPAPPSPSSERCPAPGSQNRTVSPLNEQSLCPMAENMSERLSRPLQSLCSMTYLLKNNHEFEVGLSGHTVFPHGGDQ